MNRTSRLPWHRPVAILCCTAAKVARQCVYNRRPRMAGRTITVAQQKGGAGKTTLVAHLAVAFVRSGLTVAVIDIDPQASLSRWVEARGADPGFSHQQITGWRVPAEVDKARASHDV